MYINGWPCQLWEALLANIDSKYILYHLTSGQTYNVRAFSSMMGETFFSELTLYDRRGQGTVTAKEFGQFIQDSVEKIHMRLDPDRTFVYRTTRKPVYKLAERSQKDVDSSVEEAKDQISIKCHPFDTDERTRLKCKKKEETICGDRNAILRGDLGVRWAQARRNESKLLQTTRLGIDLDSPVLSKSNNSA